MASNHKVNANKNQGSKWCSRKLRLAIYLRDGFACVYCKRNLRGAEPKDMGLDHLVCRSKGPDHRARNLVTACCHCNSKRKDMSLYAFVPNEFRRDAIYRQAKRSLRRYLAMASNLLSDSTGWRDALAKASD